MDMVEFGHHASDQTNPTHTPAGVIKISDKEARDCSTIPYIDPNPVPFTTLRLSTPPPSSGPGGRHLLTIRYHNKKQYRKHNHF